MADENTGSAEHTGDIVDGTLMMAEHAHPPGVLFQRDYMRSILVDATHAAFDLGQQQARVDYNAKIDAINATYEQRNAFAMPAVVAGLMEQAGITEISLDLGTVATVFKRCAIDYRMEEVGGKQLIHYKLVGIAGKDGA